ncbi:MAG: hypothetical protein LBV00_05265 [Propionibacteriaceae bacterium]|jgi:transglutaminase-like putative cysteine protease|nr:hypothetical protein [Propionibacteriaceae bacterium]
MIPPVLDRLLAETAHIDFGHPRIRALVPSLDTQTTDSLSYPQVAFEYVRDRIPHTTHTDRDIVTVAASQVAAEGTGICHAKANLLAALLRAKNIPAGFGYQHVTLADDNSQGYCLHAFVIAILDGRPVPLDPKSPHEFSLDSPQLDPLNLRFDEYTLPGIWADPDPATMDVLTHATSLHDALVHLPDQPSRPASAYACP